MNSTAQSKNCCTKASDTCSTSSRLLACSNSSTAKRAVKGPRMRCSSSVRGGRSMSAEAVSPVGGSESRVGTAGALGGAGRLGFVAPKPGGSATSDVRSMDSAPTTRATLTATATFPRPAAGTCPYFAVLPVRAE